jgi:UDP-glucose 4-epimerase
MSPFTGKVLVTGGTGFIGSHTCVELLSHGYDVIAVDDFSNSSRVVPQRIAELAGRPVTMVEVDVCDRGGLARVFAAHDVDAVIHFAAYKAVGESVEKPLEYYDNNLGGLCTLLAVMAEHGVRDLVFSSSCSIYGTVDSTPITEDTPANPTNPYSRTKWIGEQILRDACAARPELNVTALRYFNPTGAHPSGLLGEDPRGIPNNVVPYLMQVAIGRLSKLRVFGNDYATPDGTGVRDYIHVVDVAEGHRVALGRFAGDAGFRVLNLGTGRGTSVLELVDAFGAACGRPIAYEIVGRRPGDVDALVADPSRATDVLGWRTRCTLEDMCRDAWNFQVRNPYGYDRAAGETNVPPR